MSIAHSYPFDPTCGFQPDELLKVKPPSDEPRDFDGFWERTFQETAAVPMQTSIEPDFFADPRWRCQRVYFDTLSGIRVGSWLLEPRNRFWRWGLRRRSVQKAIVYAHGYGGREKPKWPPHFSDAVHLYVCAPGFALSRQDGIPSIASEHVLHGIGHRDTYLIRACVAVYWTAARWLVERYPRLSGGISFSGTSFGGGLGSLMLPWDRRYSCAHLVVPTFGNHPLRLIHRSQGSGDVLKTYAKDHPHVTEVLAYFDAATAAKRIKQPTLVCPARFDPAVPPPGQYAIYNAIPAKKSLFEFTAGHHPYPGRVSEYRAMDRMATKWFTDDWVRGEVTR